MTQHYLNTDH